MKIKSWIKSYPIPLWAITGLLAGVIAYFGFSNHALAEKIWYVTLLVGGAHLVSDAQRDVPRKICPGHCRDARHHCRGVDAAGLRRSGDCPHAVGRRGLGIFRSQTRVLFFRCASRESPAQRPPKKGNGLEEIRVELVKIAGGHPDR